MAYSTDNPPKLVMSVPYTDGSSDLTWNLWIYIDGDATTTVDADGYFTNGQSLGMKVNDLLILVDTGTPLISTLRVTSVSTSNDSVDMANGTTIGLNTDSD